MNADKHFLEWFVLSAFICVHRRLFLLRFGQPADLFVQVCDL
jgi:hypothetical protein